MFRSRFDGLRLAPILDYRLANLIDDKGAEFRFFGGFESITDQMLRIRGDDLTVLVDLNDAKLFLLPIEGSEAPESAEGVPRAIRWNQVSTLSEGARIFVGGRARRVDGRARFVSTRESPLLVILYDGPERALLFRAVAAGRQQNEYWNPLTPFSMAAGVFSQLLMALSFSNRPAFSAAFSASLTGAFLPLLPFLPPGLLLTVLSRVLWRRGREYRAMRDLVRLPLRHLGSGKQTTVLPDGSKYGMVLVDADRFAMEGKDIPRMPPEAELASPSGTWRCYGTVGAEADAVPAQPADPSAVYAALPDDAKRLALGYSLRARALEIASSAALFTGLGLNAALAYVLIDFFRKGAA